MVRRWALGWVAKVGGGDTGGKGAVRACEGMGVVKPTCRPQISSEPSEPSTRVPVAMTASSAVSAYDDELLTV